MGAEWEEHTGATPEEGSLEALYQRVRASGSRVRIPRQSDGSKLRYQAPRIKDLPLDPKMVGWEPGGYETVEMDLPRQVLVEIYELALSTSKPPDQIVSEVLLEGLDGACWLPTWLIRVKG